MEDKSIQYVKDCNDLFNHFSELSRLKSEPTNYYIMKEKNNISYGTIILNGDKPHLSCFRTYPAKDNSISFIKNHFLEYMDNITMQNKDEFGTVAAIKINNVTITIVDKDLQEKIVDQAQNPTKDILENIINIAAQMAGNYMDLNDFDDPRK